jgi:hypothetical protein
MIENGCTEVEAQALCQKVVKLAYDAMNRNYVFSSMSPEEQLFQNAQQLLCELDEEEKLEEMLNEIRSLESQSNESECEPSESDLEDAYNAADCIKFAGSEKQIKWARSIAANSNKAISLSNLSFNRLPVAAKWWIENRNDIYAALKGL